MCETEKRRLCELRYAEARVNSARYQALGFFQKRKYRKKPWPLMTEDEIRDIWGKDYPERKNIKEVKWAGFVYAPN